MAKKQKRVFVRCQNCQNEFDVDGLCIDCIPIGSRFKPKTNADSVRAMNDKELAEFIDNVVRSVVGGYYCTTMGKNGNEKAGCYDGDENFRQDCIDCVLEWLKQEVE